MDRICVLGELDVILLVVLLFGDVFYATVTPSKPRMPLRA